MAGFARRPGDPVGASVAEPDPRRNRRERATRETESQLVELGARFTEALLTIGSLEHHLQGPVAHQLLQRIKQRIHEDEADLARLMSEAHKQLRGEC